MLRDCFPGYLHLYFDNSSFFGALGRLCFVIVAFPGYLHLYFDNSSFFLVPLEGCAS